MLRWSYFLIQTVDCDPQKHGKFYLTYNTCLLTGSPRYDGSIVVLAAARQLMLSYLQTAPLYGPGVGADYISSWCGWSLASSESRGDVVSATPLTHKPLWYVAVPLEVYLTNSFCRKEAWALTVKLHSCDCHRSVLMRSQHQFRKWISAVRK